MIITELASNDEALGRALRTLFDAQQRIGPDNLAGVVEVVRVLLEADQARVHVADYAMQCFQVFEAAGPMGPSYLMEGTLAGRAFATGEMIVTDAAWWVPLVEGTERLGVLELSYDSPRLETPEFLGTVVTALVLLTTSKRRYTDVWLRTRRAEALSPEAEMQWDLLPPLSCSTDDVAVSGMLEPAYAIGGDSFDYAINPGRLDVAIVDAVGHGMAAVLMAACAINTLRNVRRESGTLEEAYRQADHLLDQHFGNANYVTGLIGSLDFDTGVLTWINAGHVLPLLVRNGTYAGELHCAPSMPMGLGGRVLQVATETLQRGDRVLFYTDGISESRSPDGSLFGRERLADFLVRATLDRLPTAETARRLLAAVVAHVGQGLRDDATLLLIEYRELDYSSVADGDGAPG